MITFIIMLAVFGLIAGAIARLLVPGPDPSGSTALGAIGTLRARSERVLADCSPGKGGGT